MRKGRTDGPGPVTRPTVNMTEIVFDRCANKEIDTAAKLGKKCTFPPVRGWAFRKVLPPLSFTLSWSLFVLRSVAVATSNVEDG